MDACLDSEASEFSSLQVHCGEKVAKSVQHRATQVCEVMRDGRDAYTYMRYIGGIYPHMAS